MPETRFLKTKRHAIALSEIAVSIQYLKTDNLSYVQIILKNGTEMKLYNEDATEFIKLLWDKE